MKDVIDECSSERADRRCPAYQPFRCPFQVTLVRFGPVRVDSGVAAGLITARVTGDALAAMEDLANDPNVRFKVREVAEKMFDVNTIGGERYAKLYEKVLNS